MRPRLLICAGVVSALIPLSQVHAEIRSLMSFCGSQLCSTFELVATPPDGWIEDDATSKEQGVQVFLPRGQTFGNAETLMYVKVSARDPRQSVEDFARVSQGRWRDAVRDTRIAALAPIPRRNGKPGFLQFAYENPSRPQQAHERVSFGEDTDKDGNPYFVMIVMTGRDKRRIDAADASYRAFIEAH